MKTDLFPETLLVSRAGSRIYTTSLMVAEYFGRQHAHVLRSIQRIMDETPEVDRRSNFGSATYLDGQKKPRQMYQLSHAAIGEQLGKTVGAVSYHRGQARRFGLLD